MSIHGLKEVIRNFQAQSGLQGAQRTFLLKRIIAASIGYSSICPVGEVEAAGDFFNSIVREPAEVVVSAINEIQWCEPTEVMSLAREIWITRYNIVNSPMFVIDFVKFRDNMTVYEGCDLSDKYNAWVAPFSNVIQGIMRGV